MPYRRALANCLVIVEAKPAHASQMALLQDTCFPTLAEEQRFKAEHYLKHMELFQQGQLVVLDGDAIVAATATVRLDFNFDHVDHTFADIIQGGWLTSHQPEGAWLYGADLSVAPAYRGRGLARALYAARHDLVHRLGLRGQVTAGMISGYGALKNRMSAEEYYEAVLAGRLKDSTLSMQLGVGFEPRGLLANYVNDPVCDNYSVLLVLPSEQDLHFPSR